MRDIPCREKKKGRSDACRASFSSGGDSTGTRRSYSRNASACQPLTGCHCEQRDRNLRIWSSRTWRAARGDSRQPASDGSPDRRLRVAPDTHPRRRYTNVGYPRDICIDGLGSWHHMARIRPSAQPNRSDLCAVHPDRNTKLSAHRAVGWSRRQLTTHLTESSTSSDLSR